MSEDFLNWLNSYVQLTTINFMLCAQQILSQLPVYAEVNVTYVITIEAHCPGNIGQIWLDSHRLKSWNNKCTGLLMLFSIGLLTENETNGDLLQFVIGTAYDFDSATNMSLVFPVVGVFNATFCPLLNGSCDGAPSRLVTGHAISS